MLANNARKYIKGLIDFRAGRTDDWIGTFAEAVSTASTAAQHLSNDIDSLIDQLVQQAGTPRTGSVARNIVKGLIAQPIISAEIAATRYGVTPTAARAALNRLEVAGVISPMRVGRRRNREWISEPLFQLLDNFEHTLARET